MKIQPKRYKRERKGQQTYCWGWGAVWKLHPQQSLVNEEGDQDQEKEEGGTSHEKHYHNWNGFGR